MTDTIKARFIARTLGTRTAAGFLRNRGWSFESALWVLCRKHPRTAGRTARFPLQHNGRNTIATLR